MPSSTRESTVWSEQGHCGGRQPSRRDVLRWGAAGGVVAATPSFAQSRGPAPAPEVTAETAPSDDPWFHISLAQWSLHRMHRTPPEKGGITNLEFPGFTAKATGIRAVEYVNQFFVTPGPGGGESVPRGGDFGYLRELAAAAADAEVQSKLIMIDGEGDLASSDETKRRHGVENHFKWIAAAAFLGCDAIRVNLNGDGSPQDQARRSADSLRRLARVSESYGVAILVENHGGHSSNGAWLRSVMEVADHGLVGTLPDFGNFYDYDRYHGVTDLMVHAKAVSAKAHKFDADGNETSTDFLKMMTIVKDAGYRGHVGIEYEGQDPDEVAGILATKALLERVRTELSR